MKIDFKSFLKKSRQKFSLYSIFIFINFFILHNVFSLSPINNKSLELFKNLASENWVQALKTVKKISELKIKSAEDQLIMLVNLETNVSLLEECIKALNILKSNKACKTYMELFPEIKNEIRYKFVIIQIIEALSKHGGVEEMHFLGSLLNNQNNYLYIREEIAKNFRFIKHSDASQYLIKSLTPELSILTKNILISLRYTANEHDILKIKSVIESIITPFKKNNYEKAVEVEVGDYSKSINHYILIEFLKTSIEIIQNKFIEKKLVIGDIQGEINSENFENTIKRLILEGKYKILASRNNQFPIYVPSSDEAENELFENSFIQNNSDENTEVKILIDTLNHFNIPFYRSKSGIIMEQKDTRLGRWSKDGSLLIPTHEDYIPLSLNFGNFPVRGETAFIFGETPLLVRSIDSFSSITALKAFEEKFPDIHMEALPHGYVTVKLESGEIILLGTSHIDCVFDFIPGTLTYDGHPILLIDKLYHDELMSKENTQNFLLKLKNEYSVKKVIIPLEESYLNPSNFILLPTNKIILNKAPLTYKKIINAGIKPENIIMTLKPIHRIAALKGLIGCLCGIYTEDRIVYTHKNLKIDDSYISA